MEKFLIRNENEVQWIYPEKLLAVTVSNYLCTFHREGDISFRCTKSLKEAQTLLPDCFVRISRSCIVNTDKIVSIDRKNKQVFLSNGEYFFITNFKSLNSFVKIKSEMKFTS